MSALVVDDLWALAESLLSLEPEKLKGERPCALDRTALTGVLVVRTRTHWKHLPRTEVGCSCKARWRRLDEWQAAGVWAALHRVLLKQLPNADALDW